MGKMRTIYNRWLDVCTATDLDISKYPSKPPKDWKRVTKMMLEGTSWIDARIYFGHLSDTIDISDITTHRYAADLCHEAVVREYLRTIIGAITKESHILASMPMVATTEELAK